MDNVTVVGGELQDYEIQAYIDLIERKHNYPIKHLKLILDGEFVDMHYELESKPFERIRRITGYLTNVNSCNNAKKAEIKDRLKHR